MQHQVTLTKGFWIADTTVTQALWEVIMGDNHSRFKGQEHPVDSVNWEDAQTFIAKLNNLKVELRLCLPTEAQWEYACRAGSISAFSWGEQIDSTLVNFNKDSFFNNDQSSDLWIPTVEVKSFPCNDWGLYQMHGNVWEWCRDWYGEYSASPVTDPKGPEFGREHILRGGAWSYDEQNCRSAYRSHQIVGHRFDSRGFRLARGP